MGFSITSPDLVQLRQRMTALDLTRVYQEAAYDVADKELEPRLHRAAKSAGASEELIADLGTYTGADNEVYVGIPPRAPSHREALTLEYGAIGKRPQDLFGGAIAGRRNDLQRQFSVALTKRLREYL